MSLHKNTIGWPIIAAIGVSIVVAGQFSGWNYGLAYGWLNMAVATAVMCVFYAGLLQCVSELSATWPSAGGLGTYVAMAFGERLGGFVSVAMAIALMACVGAVATFIVAYAASILPIDPLLLKVIVFTAVTLLHLRGARDALWLTLVVGLIAIATLLGFSAGVMPRFQASNLDIELGSLSLGGVIHAMPFALWLYVGVEQAITASEETRMPGRDISRGLVIALLVLTLTAFSVLLAAPGAGGVEAVAQAGDPLLAALGKANGDSAGFSMWIGLGALFGLLASFFSITYSASRQVYDLARGGFLPAGMAQVNTRGTPVFAVLAVAVAGFATSLIGPERVLLGVVLLFTSSYLLTICAFLRLRRTRSQEPRSYRTIGGNATAYLTLILSLTVLACSFKLDVLILVPIVVLFLLTSACRRWGRLSASQ
ncbi:ethanolamine permease [Pseudomonas delhiensis]|uniref:Ethanolamine permease n=1 Tax=Pseudomonas delhiensis TaxID=366289 RepID=A0A239IWP9_9PSED|nr:amino acid permease [Pseudomonas delhiensis]SDK11800.1 ethanolamine permease [Pseudomonas delhiensis]SNS97812.1 ethanolamine permease [Pseudomonas delhiensis]